MEREDGSLSDDEIRERSEFAVHLRPSIFPASRPTLVTCAREEGAPPDLVEQLERLPTTATFHTLEEVWLALGGHREERAPADHAVEQATITPEGSTHERETAPTRHFEFRFDNLHRALGLPFGVTPGTTGVEIDRSDGRLVARFGPWTVDTPLDNIERAEVTQHYSPLKTIGPAHVSLADRGLTFASNDAEGVCIAFKKAVRGIDPGGLVRHPALTVTVADPAALVDALS
jgi:hypothetical protein